MKRYVIAGALLLLAALYGCAAQAAPAVPEPAVPAAAAVRSLPAAEARPAPQPVPAEPGVHLRTIHGAQMPVLVAGEETPDLRLLNGGIRKLAETGKEPRAIPVDGDRYLQAMVVHTAEDGAPLAESFVYSLDEARAVSLCEAMRRYGVDIAALYPRYEAQLEEETGRKLTGLAAKAFYYLEEEDGILLLLAFTHRDSAQAAVTAGLCAYNSARDIFIRDWLEDYGHLPKES